MIIYKLRELMQKKSLSDNKKINYQTIADATGISRNTLTRMVNGKVAPTADTLAKLCRYFGCSFDDLMEVVDL